MTDDPDDFAPATSQRDQAGVRSPAETPVHIDCRALTDLERQLAAVWRQILGIPHVNSDDDFIGLGGDSIDAMNVVLCAEAAGLRLTFEQVLDSPSLRALAASVHGAAAGTTDQRDEQ